MYIYTDGRVSASKKFVSRMFQGLSNKRVRICVKKRLIFGANLVENTDFSRKFGVFLKKFRNNRVFIAPKQFFLQYQRDFTVGRLFGLFDGESSTAYNKKDIYLLPEGQE